MKVRSGDNIRPVISRLYYWPCLFKLHQFTNFSYLFWQYKCNLFVYLLSSKCMTKFTMHIKINQLINTTPIKYVIVNRWVELALARQEIVVSRFLRAAWDLSSARRRFLWETLEKRQCKTCLYCDTTARFRETVCRTKCATDYVHIWPRKVGKQIHSDNGSWIKLRVNEYAAIICNLFCYTFLL